MKQTISGISAMVAVLFAVLALSYAYWVLAYGPLADPPATFESDHWTSEAYELWPDWNPVEVLGRSEGHESEPMDQPITRFTPGAFFKEVTVADLSKPGYTARVRDVPESVRKQAFARYGIDYSHHAEYECDHLISLELGGSNAIENLWPEPYAGPHGARVKDQYEDWLHREVVAGRIELKEAQHRIARNWFAHMQRDMPDYKPPSER